MQATGCIKGPLGKCRNAFIIECAAAAKARHGEIQLVDVIAIFLKIIKPNNPLQPIIERFTEQLNFLRKLLLLKVIGKL